jgi:hypothetical protein
MHGKKRNSEQFWVESMKEKDSSEELALDRKMLLK